MKNNQIQFIGVTPTELKKDIVTELTTSLLKSLSQEFTPKQPTEYLTRIEVANLLQIDLSTVHNWTKKGIITSYGIGGRVYYKRQEIEQAIIKLK